MGHLNRFQEEAVRYYVKGQLVWDLGAGLLGWAHRLVSYGAKKVVAVDKIYRDRHENICNGNRTWGKVAPAGVALSSCTFRELATGIEDPNIPVAFVSWPESTWSGTMGLELVTHHAQTVIYLGNNHDGTCCGSSIFWSYMRCRKVLCVLPSRVNTLIVYGRTSELRDRLEEEVAGMDHNNVLPTPKWYP